MTPSNRSGSAPSQRRGGAGRRRVFSLMLTLCLALPAQAALYAALDRYRIAMGDTARLTLRSDDDSDPGDADLSALREHFEILEQSSSVSTRIVNGQHSQSRELILEITPRREGSIVIPPFAVDGKRSEALAVDVGPAPQARGADEVVSFEAEIDRSSLYVQGQLQLTLRVQQAVNLESRSITELDIPGAYVQTLGQNSFQRMIEGRPWLVHEIRYAIFPEASGELVIPAQTFSGRLGAGRRTLFDTLPAGQLIRRRSEAIAVNVKPRPADFPAATWLPAADLGIEEQWSAPPDTLRVGDSVTRTIRVTADGLQGAQLAPIEHAQIAGLRAYPDQPVIDNVHGAKGLTGIRTDSLALVAVQDGEYELPAIEVPWWDTGSDTLRVARLPARRLRVLPGAAAQDAADARAPEPAAAPPVAPSAGLGLWPWIAAGCALGWLLSSLGWWRSKTRSPGDPRRLSAPRPTARADLKALLTACKADDARLARRELQTWVRGLRGQGRAQTLLAWAEGTGSDALRKAVQDLETALYRGAQAGAWHGGALAEALRALRAASGERRKGARSEDSALPPLYLGQ